MHLTRIHLQDFRNVTACLELSPGLNVFHGRNGQGKSNILEAVHVAAYGRSFRPGRLADLVRFEQPFARVELALHDGEVEIPLILVVSDGDRRHQVGGKENCTLLEVSEVVRVIFFGPDDLDLVKGGRSARREFLDRAIVVHHPPYAEVLKGYNRLLKERNLLLRDYSFGRPPPFGLMESYEEELARHAARIYSYRLKYLREFIPMAQRLLAEHSGNRLELTIHYQSDFEPVAKGTSQEARVLFPSFRERLEGGRSQDAAAGRTLVGPHLDDVELLIGGRPARYFASQGEQRQLAVSLKIAQLALWKERFGINPVLLLDDVLSELDPERSRLLFSRILEWGVQTLISTTDRSDMLIEDECRFFQVTEGAVTGE